MNFNQNFVFHKKSKSINNKLSLKDFDYDNNLISVQVNTNNFIFNNDLKNKNNVSKTKTTIPKIVKIM